MNTRFLEVEYDYVKPATLEEALSYLDQGKKVKIFAGGTDLVVKMKVGALTELDTMVDINGIPGLDVIQEMPDKTVRIGATAKLSHIEKNPLIQQKYNCLFEALSSVGSISIRNMGTIGGNFCNASPVADPVGPVICCKGSVELSSKRGARLVPAEKFFVKPGVSVIEPDEIMTAVVIPALPANTGDVFIKFGRIKADIAKISLTAVIERDGETIKSCRLAMGSVAATPLFLEKISDELCGKTMSQKLIEETAQAISDFIKPIDDTRTTAEYRKDISKIIAEDALAVAWKRSGGKSL